MNEKCWTKTPLPKKKQLVYFPRTLLSPSYVHLLIMSFHLQPTPPSFIYFIGNIPLGTGFTLWGTFGLQFYIPLISHAVAFFFTLLGIQEFFINCSLREQLYLHKHLFHLEHFSLTLFLYTHGHKIWFFLKNAFYSQLTNRTQSFSYSTHSLVKEFGILHNSKLLFKKYFQ